MIYSESYESAMDKKYQTTMATDTLRNIYFSAPTSSTEPGKQLKDIIDRAGGGIKNVEIGQIGAQKWEAIPREHFNMARQIAKLTMGEKALVSVHAPVDVDPTGFKSSQQGGRWSEDNRVESEEFMKDVIDKAQMVQTDDKRPVPIAFHASGQVGTMWKWNDDYKRVMPEYAFGVVPDTGELVPLTTEEKVYPGGEKVKYVPYKVEGVEYNQKDRIVSSLDQMNHTLWQREQEKVSQMWKEIQEAQRETARTDISKEEKERWKARENLMTQHLRSAIHSTYNKLAETDNVAKEFIDQNTGSSDDIVTLTAAISRLGVDPNAPRPKIVRLADEFGKEKAAKTFANLAKYSYDKYGEYGPQLAVENWDPWHIMGRGEELAKGLKLGRKEFVEKLVKEDKLPVKKANEIAERLIGATWDIAHINMMRKFGVPERTSKEVWEKHIKKEVEAIEKDIRHIHISDNFGFSDVHLAPGMGNVPIKEFLDHMQKTGKLKDVASVLESAGTAIHLGIPPSHSEALQHLGISSPAWSTSPNWYEIGQNYFFGGSNYASAGFGNILPQGHFSEYGAGFSQLPTATGGMRPGQQSKFSGTPMN